MCFLKFLISIERFWSISGSGRSRNVDNFIFFVFSRNLNTHTKNFEEILEKVPQHGWAAKKKKKKKKSRVSEIPVSSLWEFIIFKKIKIGKKLLAINGQFSSEKQGPVN